MYIWRLNRTAFLDDWPDPSIFIFGHLLHIFCRLGTIINPIQWLIWIFCGFEIFFASDLNHELILKSCWRDRWWDFERKKDLTRLSAISWGYRVLWYYTLLGKELKWTYWYWFRYGCEREVIMYEDPGIGARGHVLRRKRHTSIWNEYRPKSLLSSSFTWQTVRCLTFSVLTICYLTFCTLTVSVLTFSRLTVSVLTKMSDPRIWTFNHLVKCSLARAFCPFYAKIRHFAYFDTSWYFYIIHYHFAYFATYRAF